MTYLETYFYNFKINQHVTKLRLKIGILVGEVSQFNYLNVFSTLLSLIQNFYV